MRRRSKKNREEVAMVTFRQEVTIGEEQRDIQYVMLGEDKKMEQVMPVEEEE